MLDALNRRRRDGPPQPDDDERTIEIEESDLAIFRPLKMHGLLHTDYLYHYWQRHHSDLTRFRKRLTKLYNGVCAHPEHRKRNIPLDEHGKKIWTHTCVPIRYLTRDPDQEENKYYGRGNSLVYGLTSRAEDELDAAGLALKHEFRRSNSYIHDFGLACVTASFELQARKFWSREAIIGFQKAGKYRCPAETRAEDAPFYFLAGTEHIYPDDIFGNEYEEGKSRYFFLEFDRAQKAVRADRSKTPENTIEYTLKAYQRILDTESYKRLGIPNISILITTTLDSKMRRMMQCVREVIEERYQSHFLFKTFPIFGKPWRTPKELLPVMTGWIDANGREQDISKKAP